MVNARRGMSPTLGTILMCPICCEEKEFHSVAAIPRRQLHICRCKSCDYAVHVVHADLLSGFHTFLVDMDAP